MIFGKFFGKLFGTGGVKRAATKAKVSAAPTMAQMAATAARMPSHAPNPHSYHVGGGTPGRFGRHRPAQCRGKSNRRKAARLARKRH